MSKIYVPEINNGNCVTVLDHDTIRVFESTPQDNTEINFVDYYINSSYLSSTGSIVFAAGSVKPVCISSDNITTDFYYRNDLDKILVIFFIIAIICIYLPYKIFSRAFGRWLKL